MLVLKAVMLSFSINGIRHAYRYSHFANYINPAYSLLARQRLIQNVQLQSPISSRSPFFQRRHLFSYSSTNTTDEVVTSNPLTFPSATCTIKELEDTPIGTNVVVHGYVGPRSDISKDLSFVTLYSDDLADKIQVVSSSHGESAKHHVQIRALRLHTPVAIGGFLADKKPPKKKTPNPASRPSREIQLGLIQPLNDVADDLVIKEETNFPPEKRYLQIRTDVMLRKRLLLRADIANSCRTILQSEHAFVEVETPILFKSTAEGAREFLVPTRTKGTAYALPQSPQQYKQVLMASGIPKYFQLARCFRDEDLRADRQPEFTQLDLEMAFAKEEDVIKVIEALIKKLWSRFLGISLQQSSFDKLSYESAMQSYGSDKPDRRIKMKIKRLLDEDTDCLPAELVAKVTSIDNPIIEGFKINLPGGVRASKEFINKFMDTSVALPFLRNPEGQPGIFFYDSGAVLQGLSSFGFENAEVIREKFDLTDGDVLVIQARKKSNYSSGSTSLGNFRLALHKAAVAASLAPPPSGFDVVWITDFPLFTKTIDSENKNGKDGNMNTVISTHHPFTAPRDLRDLKRYAHDPTKIRASHYDLVINGVELGGGSQRIHIASAQRYVFESLLRLNAQRVEEFAHLLGALRAGCPPHAGIALGFDRLLAVMMGAESVKDVIAFPKSGGKGEDMMVKSPGKITDEQLETYGLKLRD